MDIMCLQFIQWVLIIKNHWEDPCFVTKTLADCQKKVLLNSNFCSKLKVLKKIRLHWIDSVVRFINFYWNHCAKWRILTILLTQLHPIFFIFCEFPGDYTIGDEIYFFVMHPRHGAGKTWDKTEVGFHKILTDFMY